MALGLLVDALAPTNFLPTNPAALQRAFDTAGGSLIKGARAFVGDVINNGGKPRQVDTSGFEVGVNVACTPSKVVYRNDLMELLQYEPQTEQVHATPLLCSPPWINKYYVMDLAPNRSFIEWAVKHGRTVFAISYRNPSAEMSGTTMDDYLVKGPQTALDVIEQITGAETIDIVGLCLGGAMTAITAAYLTQEGDSRIGTLTLLNTMLDYAEPGALGAFTDIKTVERLEKKMLKAGALEGETMAGTFDVLRANDLIFNYVVSNWLMGQPPPAFDILAWNADSTRMPAAMHAFYLRNFYVENKLAAGELELGGARIDLSRDQVADLRGERDQRSHRALGIGLQDGRPGQRTGPVRAGQRRAHRRHRQPARTQGLAHGQRQRLAAGDRRGVAGDRRTPAWDLVGGLGGVVRRQFRAAAGPAPDGQRHLPGARRGAGDATSRTEPGGSSDGPSYCAGAALARRSSSTARLKLATSVPLFPKPRPSAAPGR